MLTTDPENGSILSKTWEELEALEYQDRLLFPFEIMRKRAKGWEKTPVALRVPREPDAREARAKARAWAKEEGLDPELDSDLFDNMDTMVMLSLSIRNIKPPHEPWEPDYKKLEERYDRPSLDAAWSHLEALRSVIDPRPEEIDRETTIGLIGVIAKKRNIVPLAAYAGRAQNSCIVTMAELAQSYLDSKSSSE